MDFENLYDYFQYQGITTLKIKNKTPHTRYFHSKIPKIPAKTCNPIVDNLRSINIKNKPERLLRCFFNQGSSLFLTKFAFRNGYEKSTDYY